MCYITPNMTCEAKTGQPSTCVFNDLKLLSNLFKNIVPEELRDRLQYSSDQTGGVDAELYYDTQTGDTFKSGTLPTCPVSNFWIVKTKVGEYEILTQFGKGGELASAKYFIDSKEIESDDFFSNLSDQTNPLK